MYTTNSSTLVNGITIPHGAQVIRNDEFLWPQMMSSVRILSNKSIDDIKRDRFVVYCAEGEIIGASLDKQDNLYLWVIDEIQLTELLGE